MLQGGDPEKRAVKGKKKGSFAVQPATLARCKWRYQVNPAESKKTLFEAVVVMIGFVRRLEMAREGTSGIFTWFLYQLAHPKASIMRSKGR